MNIASQKKKEIWYDKDQLMHIPINTESHQIWSKSSINQRKERPDVNVQKEQKWQKPTWCTCDPSPPPILSEPLPLQKTPSAFRTKPGGTSNRHRGFRLLELIWLLTFTNAPQTPKATTNSKEMTAWRNNLRTSVISTPSITLQHNTPPTHTHTRKTASGSEGSGISVHVRRSIDLNIRWVSNVAQNVQMYPTCLAFFMMLVTQYSSTQASVEISYSKKKN